MADPSLDRLHTVLHGLSSGADPARLLSETLGGAIAAARAADGMVVRTAADRTTVVATTGAASPFLRDTAQAAVTSDRLQRRRDPQTGTVAIAEPLRAGGKVVGALAVAGDLARVDPAALPVWAEVAGLVVGRQVPTGDGRTATVVDALAAIGAEVDVEAVLSAMFDALFALASVTSGFCAVFSKGSVRVGQYRGVEHDRLVEASRVPEFRLLLAGDSLQVVPAAHPVVARLARLGETGVSVPLLAGGEKVGHLVALLPHPPDAATQAVVRAIADHAANALRAASTQERLREHEQHLGSIVHSIANPIVVVDEAGQLVEVNGAAAELFRLATGFEAGHPVQGRLGSGLLEHMLVNGDDRSVEVVLNPEAPRVYRATVRRIRSSSGTAMGRILVLDDLTSERQAESIKADFVAVIGHELRTPLTVMKGYLHSLTRRWQTLGDDKREQALTALQGNVFRLERLIEDLLFVSAIEQRRCKLDLELHDVGAALELRRTDRVEVRRPRRPVEIEVDLPKLDQVVHHLLDNALKYSEGPVVLELVDRGDEIEISVTDTGPGIFSGDVPFLFERFRQLDGTSTRSHGGVGIGLYLCKRIVEALGGRIGVDSRLGVGSRFAFALPKDGPSDLPAVTAPREVGVSLG